MLILNFHNKFNNLRFHAVSLYIQNFLKMEKICIPSRESPFITKMININRGNVEVKYAAFPVDFAPLYMHI